MVDVSEKSSTARVAVAKGCLILSPEAAQTVRAGTASKGDVLQIARIAGIQAAKQTSHLIPLCHLLPLEKVMIVFEWLSDNKIQCVAEVKATAKTGVEMEALTAVSVSLLTMYDMLKAIDRTMEIVEIALWHKEGGVRGAFHRETATGQKK
jgi:cyclic pyranopterin phosphate synthase